MSGDLQAEVVTIQRALGLEPHNCLRRIFETATPRLHIWLWPFWPYKPGTLHRRLRRLARHPLPRRMLC
ncbi:MAG TPA: hypothetical protein VOA64_14425, partial [Candidatus Dormibacteraeota bacterium]|nr:hypothetical protein [Candidatus Dormibacteraeota bacterium]